MNFEVALEGTVPHGSEAEVDHVFGALMEALVDLGVDDPFVGGSAVTGQLEIAITVDAESDVLAYERGCRMLAKALEKAGVTLNVGSESSPPGLGISDWRKGVRLASGQ